MYYENIKKKGSAFLVRRANGVVALRVIIKSKKFERSLFKWPAEAFDVQRRMILPICGTDSDYIERLREALEAIDKAQSIMCQDHVFDIETFSKAWEVTEEKEVMLSYLLEEFMQSLNASSSTKRIYKGRVSAILQILGNVPAHTISAAHLSKIDAHFSSKSRASAKLCHAVLSNAIKLGVSKNYMRQSPYFYFKCAVKTKEVKRPTVSLNEVEKLFRAWEQALDGIERKAMQVYLLQCYTGARFSDAERLTTADFERGYFVCKKTGKSNLLVMSDKLKVLCPETALHINYEAYRRALKRISESLCGNYVQSHAARRFFAMQVFKHSQHNLKTVQAALGHSSLKNTEIYVHSENESIESAIKAVGDSQNK